MSRIAHNLWLCSWEEAKSFVPALNNPLVINCTKDLPFITENTIRIPIDDTPDDSKILNNHIFKICRKMYDYLASGSPVVVHCLAGMSRSCSVVVCYLLIYGDIIDPFQYVRDVRKGSMMFNNFEKTIKFTKSHLKM